MTFQRDSYIATVGAAGFFGYSYWMLVPGDVSFGIKTAAVGWAVIYIAEKMADSMGYA